MYFSKNFTLDLTNMLIIFIINIYYNLNRFFNCTTLNMYGYRAHNTHCTYLGLHFQGIYD